MEMDLEQRVGELEKRIADLEKRAQPLDLATEIIKALDKDREKNLQQIMTNLDEHFRTRFGGY